MVLEKYQPKKNAPKCIYNAFVYSRPIKILGLNVKIIVFVIFMLSWFVGLFDK